MVDAAIHNPDDPVAELMLQRAQNLSMEICGMYERPFPIMRLQRIHQDCSFELIRRRIAQAGYIGRNDLRETRARILEEVRQTKNRISADPTLGFVNEDIFKLGLRLNWLRDTEEGNFRTCSGVRIFSAFSRQDHAKHLWQPRPYDPELRQSVDVCRLGPRIANFIQCKLSTKPTPNRHVASAGGKDISNVISSIRQLERYMPDHNSQIFRSFWAILSATEDILATNDTLRALYGFIDVFGEDIRITRMSA